MRKNITANFVRLAALTSGLFLIVSTPVSFASQLYRYTDDNGNTVLNRTIPPKYVAKGYDILNERGRLVERIAPALTPEQIAVRDAEQEQKRQLEIAREKQSKIDNELKQLYSHPDDVVRVLKRRIQDIKAVVQVNKGKIESAEKQVMQEESKAADRQRRGMAIPEIMLAKISSLKKDIVNAKADIEELKTEQEKVLQEFDVIVKRMETITNKQASDYGPFLESLKQQKAQNIVIKSN